MLRPTSLYNQGYSKHIKKILHQKTTNKKTRLLRVAYKLSMYVMQTSVSFQEY